MPLRGNIERKLDTTVDATKRVGYAEWMSGPSPIIKRRGANLPHWTREDAAYAVTFRLADSLPAAVLVQWEAERDDIVRRAAAMDRPLSVHERERLHVLHSERVERWLDQGHGSCSLRDPAVAQLVCDALKFFDGQRHDNHAWCIMPNHVHWVLRPRPGFELARILQSVKGFTGKRANELLGKPGGGEFWQAESYDHLIRDGEDLLRQIAYVVRNPAAAGMVDWPWVWRK